MDGGGDDPTVEAGGSGMESRMTAMLSLDP
jgi:hypothetical protein